MFRYLPEQASKHAADMDWLHNWITDISVISTVLICGAMLYFAIRYRKKDGVDHETPRILGSHFLEFLWTFVPTVICIFIAYYGVVIYKDMVTAPEGALVVNATGSQWKWQFDYDSGKKTIGELVIPVETPVKIVMTSEDVLHSFFIPAMRVKKDAIQGQYTHVSFTGIEVGEYPIFCTEYCGVDHSAMLGKVRVVPKDEYNRWVNDLSEKAVSPYEKGKLLFGQQGCKSCHSLDGSRVVGPSLLKLFGREEKLATGETIKVDENYLRESIINPNAKIVATYPANVMPAFPKFSEDDLRGMIAFIKAQDGSQAAAPVAASDAPAADDKNATPAEKGKKIYETKMCMGCHSLDGSKVVGPSFKGIYGRESKMADGSKVKADDAYLKQSILEPTAKVVEGYPPAMPSYKDQLSDEDIKNVIEFLSTVK
jgi:cytochrome c oxidase subunit 2